VGVDMSGELPFVRRSILTGLAAVAVMTLGFIVAGYCAGRAQGRAVERHASDRRHEATRDSARAEKRVLTDSLRQQAVAFHAEHFRAESLATIATRHGGEAALHRMGADLLAVDRSLLPAAVVEQMRLDAVALASYQIATPAALVALDNADHAVTTGLLVANASIVADVAADSVIADSRRREHEAHRRGVVQGIKGTVTVLAVVVVTAAAWSIAKVRR
jgi:hypothetical protein